MQKLSLALGLLFLPVVGWSQSQAASPQITVRDLTLHGVTQISPEDQRQIASEIKNQAPLALTSLGEINERLRYAFQKLGFFRASASAPRVTVITSSPDREVIDVIYDVHEGQQYRLKQITFSSNQPAKSLAFSDSELRQAFEINDGAIFDTEKIRVGLEQLRKLYAGKGYVNFTPVPNTEADDESATIALRIDLDEGLIFQVGNLALDGVEPVPGAGARLIDAWKQYRGQTYSPDLIANFIRENASYLPIHATEAQLFEIRQDAQQRALNFRLELGGPAASK